MKTRETSKGMVTIDEVADKEMERAKIKNFPDPDFDFRKQYNKGDKIYYTHVVPELGIKEILALTVQSVFARTLTAFEPKSVCHVINYRKRDYIFKNRADALALYDKTYVKEVS